MITYIIYILLLLPLCNSAADHSDQLSIDFMQLNHDDIDQSPEGFMKRLKEAEAAQNAPRRRQKFGPLSRCEEVVTKSPLQAQSFMQTNGYGDYYDYFVALAASNLTDKEKVEERFVMIPYFKKLQLQPIEIRETAYEICRASCKSLKYSSQRLLFAAFYRIDININKRRSLLEKSPLESSLSHDDIPLLQIALDCGADPNENRGIHGSTLEQCRSVDAAKLLLHYGADFDRQHQEKDLIRPLCCGTSTDSDDKLLPLFLSYVRLDAPNRFGQEWIEPLARSAYCFHYANFSERLSILLRHGCHYNQKDQDKIIESINKTTLWSVSTEEEKQEKRQEIGNLFNQDKKRRTNIVVGLQNRARTGKPLIRNTNLSACYNRALEMEKPKKKEDPVVYSPKWHILPKIGEMLFPFNNHL